MAVKQWLIIGGIALMGCLGYWWWAHQGPLGTRFPIKAPAATLVQLRLESKMEADISALLNQLVGDGHYHVSVISQLDVSTERRVTVMQNPTTVTTNASETVAVNRYRTPKTKPLPVPEAPAESMGLPGFNTTRFVKPSPPKKTYSADSLPGFPEPATVAPAASAAPPSPTPNTMSAGPVMDETFGLDEQSLKTQTGTQVLINETKTEQVVESNIKNMVVTVVIDSDAFLKANIDKPELMAIIAKQAVINRARGDVLTISFVPFKTQRWSIVYAQRVLTQPWGWGSLCIIFVGVMGWVSRGWVFRAWQKHQRARRIKNAHRQHEQSEEGLLTRWHHHDAMVRQSLDEQPDQVAGALARWMVTAFESENAGSPLTSDQVGDVGKSGGEQMNEPPVSGLGTDDQVIDEGRVP